jgi:D-alanyl-D-alanine carboxypeptidase
VNRVTFLAAAMLTPLLVVGGPPAEPAATPSAIEPELAVRLQAALDETRAATGTMGVSAAVIMPDGTLWTGVSGVSHPGAPITTDMLFDMGSTGKNLMAALVLDLVDEGLLSLEDPISKYLPPYPNVDGAITIRQLLDHTSGLYMWVEHPDSPINTPFAEIDFDRWWTVEEMFTKLGGAPYFAPGEGWHYTQAGFQLARLIVEQVTDSAAPVEIQTRLLDPLDIHGMLLDMREPIPPRHRIAHAWYDTDGDGVPEDISSRSRNWINSLSGIYYYTTMQSLARWLRGLFDGKVLSEAALREMLDFRGPLTEEGLAGYGLGTERFMMGPVEMWGHKGSIFGYRTGVYHLVQHDITVALAINDDGDEKGYALFGALVEALLAER